MTKAEAHLIKFADLLCKVMDSILTTGPTSPAFLFSIKLVWTDFTIKMYSAHVGVILSAVF